MKMRYLFAILAAMALGIVSLANAGPGFDRSGVSSRWGSSPPPAIESTDEADDENDDQGNDEGDDAPSFCSETAQLMFRACRAEVLDDFYAAQAICIQVLDAADRTECFVEAGADHADTRELCNDQRAARLDLCELVGQDRYDPEFEPELFIDDFTSSTPNPYYPLVIGYRWEFQAADESNVIEVLDKTKLIEGVTCIVINDFVTGEDAGEDTDDWYAQRLDGSVAYCGESVADFEFFEGDNPQEPEVVAIDGSFKHGRDGDLAGTIMPASPSVGQAYRQEMSLGNAEDAAIILSTTYGYGTGDPDLDAFVPRDLADLLCNDDCVVTGELTPVEPDVFDRKYYAPGIGLFFEVKPGTGETNQLVSCNVDPRCASLPRP